MKAGSRKLKTLAVTPPWEWPEDAGTLLGGILEDRSAADTDRLLAAELAGDIVVASDDLAATLLAVVRDSRVSSGVRAQAARSLGPMLEYVDTDDFEVEGDAPISQRTFRTIQGSLRELFLDAGIPNEVRRSILEGSVRAPQDWHPGAVGAAYRSDDDDWKRTAVFCMSHVPGFDAEIVELLGSPNPDIQYEAVRAAGACELAGAWSQIVALLKADETPKPLLLAAIEAAAQVRPEEAPLILADFADSPDEEIVEAAQEALAMAEGLSDEDDLDEDDEDLDDDDDDR
jgi:hypothetical protein